MDLEAVLRVIGVLSPGAIGLFAYWKSRQVQRDADRTRRESREVADIDAVRALLAQENEKKEARLSSLENFMTASIAAKDHQIEELKEEVLRERADVAKCQQSHAETRIALASVTAEREFDRALIAENRQLIEQYVDRIADLETNHSLMQGLIERRKLNRED